jgi:hypothetical protein
MQPTVQPYFDPVTARSVTWFSSPGNWNARSLTRFSTMTQSQDALQRRMQTGSSSSCARKACTLSGFLKRTPTLATPVLIVPSVQVDMRAGDLPPAEEYGTRYLKIPLSVL